MADDGSAQSTNVWPLPKFYFQVKWDSEEMSFQEVSGLDIEANPLSIDWATVLNSRQLKCRG